MAGAKRQTPYRKNVTHDVLEGLPEPDEAHQQLIARVVEPRGSNMFKVETASGDSGLCLLPTKFRKLVWIKRGDYVIASRAEGDYDTAEGSGKGKVNFVIDHILFPKQIAHLQQRGKWPKEFQTASVKQKHTEKQSTVEGGGCINESSFFDMAEEMGGNPNHKPHFDQQEDSDSSSSSSSEEEDVAAIIPASAAEEELGESES